MPKHNTLADEYCKPSIPCTPQPRSLYRVARVSKTSAYFDLPQLKFPGRARGSIKKIAVPGRISQYNFSVTGIYHALPHCGQFEIRPSRRQARRNEPA